MRFHRGKLKHLIALGGIALTLLPCLQQSHALCRLAGCVGREASIPAEPGVCASNRGACCGCHSEVPCESPSEDHGNRFPCGPECHLARPVEPREAPRDSTASTISEIVATCSSVAQMDNLVSCGPHANLADLELGDQQFKSSLETCARLCRYLT